MSNPISEKVPRRSRLSNESTGECPCGCGDAAYPYEVKGIEGYFDAAPRCAAAISLDFVAERAQ